MKKALLMFFAVLTVIMMTLAFASCNVNVIRPSGDASGSSDSVLDSGLESNKKESESYSEFEGLSESDIFSDIDNSSDDNSSSVEEPLHDSYVKDGEIFYFEGGKRVDIDKAFATVSGKKYYAVNNMIFFNINIIDGRVHDFGDDGALTDRSFDNEFVTVEGKTYYAVNNEIVINVTIIVGMNVYNFGEDGALTDKVFDKEIVEVNNKKYYVENNVIIINITVIVNGNVYRFGSDGALTDKVYDREFVSVGDKKYYVENNVVIINVTIILDGKVYEIGNDGTATNRVYNGETVEVDGKEYYIENNIVVINITVIINNKVYYFGNDGAKTDKVFDDGLIELRTKVGEGKYKDKIYYIVNNTVIINIDVIINGQLYRFGSDGAKTDEIVSEKFFDVGEDRYYIVDNKVTVGYMVYDKHIYSFDDDGKMRRNTEYEGYWFNDLGILENNSETLQYIIVKSVKYLIFDDGIYLTGEFAGKVVACSERYVDGEETAVEGAVCTAEIFGVEITVTSDASGLFTLSDLPVMTDEIKLVIEKAGYQPIEYYLSNGEDEKTFVFDIDVSNTLKGRIFIADADMDFTNNVILKNAEVVLTKISGTNAFTKTAYSDISGNYEFNALPGGKYKLTVSAEGYISISQIIIININQTTVQNIALEMIVIPEEGHMGSAAGTIKNSTTGSGVSGLALRVYKGVNTTEGEIIATLTTNSAGEYRLSNVAPGNYTLGITDERELANEDMRFGEGKITIKVLADMTISNQDAVVSNNMNIAADSMRIVLRWGANPGDLDSHLTYGGNHIYYGCKNGTGANLDVDDTSSYGPETVTITSFMENTVYTYYIHDYTNRNYLQNTVLANSGATIEVYIGGNTPIYTFNVPSGTGVYWKVFSYDTATGNFIIHDQITNSL